MTVRSTLRGTFLAGRLAGAVGAVAMAGSDQDRRNRARAHLAEVLGRERGLPAKVGQWLALTPGDSTFAALGDGLTPLPWDTIAPVLATAWGRDPMAVLAEIDPCGRAASLGQVHRGRLHDGRLVAIKVRYPGIADAVEDAVGALSLLPAVGPVRRAGLDLDAHRSVIATTIRRELDYRIEAASQRRAHSRPIPGIVVPAIHPDLSTTEVLVQDWEAGETLDQAATWPEADRDAAGLLLIRRFLVQALEHGEVHGDPNPGNIRFRRGPDGVSIIQYDHGAMAEVPPARASAIRALVTGLRRGDTPRDVLAPVGFDPQILARLSDPAVATVARTLVAPLLVDAPWPAATWMPGTEIAGLLEEDRWTLRAAGDPSLFLLTRAYAGLVRHLRILRATVAWTQAWPGPPLPTAMTPPQALDNGRRVRIEIRDRNGDERVCLSLPMAALDDVAATMGEDLVEVLTRDGHDVLAIIARARAAGFPPGDLFSAAGEMTNGWRSVRIRID